MPLRYVTGFFYGLFMDKAVLEEAGVAARNPQMAYVEDFGLRIGRRATLVPEAGARAYGMLYDLMHEELGKLYGAPGLEDYRPEAVEAHLLEGGHRPALCYNLLDAPAPGEANAAYAKRLSEALKRLGFPADYVASIHRA